MRCARQIFGMVLCASMLGVLASGPAHSEEAQPKVTLNGLIDWYYQYSMNHPPSGSGSLVGRSFDVKNNAFSLSLAELNVSRATTAKSPLGFTATLTFGKTADLVSATEPGGNVGTNGVNDTSYKYIQQLYATYVTGGSRPITIDFGKYVTHMGYEVIESVSNDNYSRSFLFNYAIPFYHMGARITVPFSPTLTGQLHLVNGWNNVEDDNGAKSLGLQLNYKPSDKANVILNWMGGNESTGAGMTTDRNTQVVDLVTVLNPSPRFRWGLNADYGGAFAPGNSGTWSGQALYARYQLSAASALALRLERFQDSGLRLPTATTANSYTLTYEYVAKGALTNRIEYRHDHAGQAIFPSGGGSSNDQDTLSFSQVYKF